MALRGPAGRGERCRLTAAAGPTPLPRRRPRRRWLPLRRAGIRPRPPSPRRPPAPQVSAQGCRGSQPPPLPDVRREGGGARAALSGAAERLGPSRRAGRAEISLAGHGRAAHRSPHGPHLSPLAFTSVWVSARPDQRVLGWKPCLGHHRLSSILPSSSFSPVKASLLYRLPVPLSGSPGKINQPLLLTLFLGAAAPHPRLHSTPEASLEPRWAPG